MMREYVTRSISLHALLIALVLVTAFGCATLPPAKPASDLKQIVGKWEGTGDEVRFPGKKSFLSPALSLTGKLGKPSNKTPAPAVVLMHGCGGIRPYHEKWAARINKWGYVTLLVDSFGPRGLENICRNPRELTARKRAADAHAAKVFLQQQPFVDPKRIAVMGWSHGGSATLDAVGGSNDIPFRAGVAMYPWCPDIFTHPQSPLLILTGGLDELCPAERCQEMLESGDYGGRVVLHVYSKAHHGFDWEGMDKVFGGKRLKYNPQAAADSIKRVRGFLDKNLK